MKKYIIILLLSVPFLALAVNITVPQAPGENYLLLSTSTGNYNYVSTSTIGSILDTLWARSGNNIYNLNSGNVGIGTTTPGSLLGLYSTSTIGTQIDLNNGSAGGRNWTVGSAGAINTTCGIGNLCFYDGTAGLVRLVINPTGLVGIGTTTPATLLHVNQTAVTGTREIISKFTVSDANNDGLYIGNGTITDGTMVPSIQGMVNTSNAAALNFRGYTTAANDTGTNALVEFQALRTDNVTSPGNGTLSTAVTRPLFNFRNLTTDVMTIIPNGNVGIGSSTPISSLSITGRGGIMPLSIASSSGVMMLEMEQNGNLGLGTTTAGNPLVVSRDAVSGPGVDAGQLCLTGSTSGNKKTCIGFDTTGNFGFLQPVISGTAFQPMAINPYGGNVGIATTTPGDKLSVAGLMQSQGLVFISSSTPTYRAGTMVYDATCDCLTTYNSDSNISLQNGQEVWTRVRNVTGSTILNGSAVYANGSNSGLTSVALARADAGTTTVVVGMATEDIANNATGTITIIGVVNGLNTSAYAPGTTVYLSATTSGGLASTSPAAPNYRMRVGIVGVSSATVGTINVTPSTASVANGIFGQFLSIDASGRQVWLATSTLNIPPVTVSAWLDNGTSVYLATSTRNVGIGTSTPISTLGIQGRGGINPFSIASSTGALLLEIAQNGSVGIGTTPALAKLHVLSTTEQLRLSYDASNYVTHTVDSTGRETLDATGTGAGFTFSKPVLLAPDYRNGVTFFTDLLTQISSGFGGDPFMTVTSGTTFALSSGGQNRPGVQTYGLASATGKSFIGVTSSTAANTSLETGGGPIVYESDIQLGVLSSSTQRYVVLGGFLNTAAGINQNNAMYLLYDEGGVTTGSVASPNWQIVSVAATSSTFVTTSVAAVAGTWTKLRVEVNSAGTIASYYINGTLAGTSSTNIPSGTAQAFGAGTYAQKSIGTSPVNFAIDFIYISKMFSSSR
jgi:uncharacterized protein with putative carbohydrate binding module